MSKYVVFNNSTNFRLKNGEESVAAIRALIDEHMDGYRIKIEAGKDNTYFLDFGGGDVGDSFNSRVGDLIKAMAPHTLDAFVVKITVESLSEDNSEEIFGGPDEDAISAYMRKHAISEAMDILRGSAPDAYDLLQGALKGSVAAAATTPKIVITMEGGVLQGVMSDLPVDVFTVNYDTEGEDLNDLISLPQGNDEINNAICAVTTVEVNPDRVAEFSEIITEHESRQNTPRERG